ncbi:hypothetical protein QKU48_gp0583 [Fadolivirus algeromassiliense]|jgi:hypothetical protein|uniref:Uncharacterized protein n=1 Tax=Fadolivirus FV1/VV64 TaxID=3070911 RepID=A0A7D3R0X9_9VIRU|nr:hypothetical protein QKU48_gp0583 [Fadolivirus algeromassiliense]QKF94041.1 hypothetical protein Fadolivirus_1_583 [Fadolivirus FV1/VV64]
MIKLNINIDVLLILALIVVFVTTVSYLGKYNVCDHGLCKIYDNYNTYTFNILLYLLIIIAVLIALYYLFL